jgi:hypothetical protein
LILAKKTKRGRERILAVLLTAMLIMSCLPAGMAFGAVAAPAAPAISPNGGSISVSADVGIEATLTVSQAVYYTIAAGDTGAVRPETGSVNTYVYTAPFAVSPTAGAYTVNAAVYDADSGLWSGVDTALFLVVSDATGAPAAPAISPNGGSISTSTKVGIEATLAVSQAVYYTKDGSWPYLEGGTPSVGASVYAEPFTLPAGAYTVNAAVYDADSGLWSGVVAATFDVRTSGGGGGGGGTTANAPSVKTEAATEIADNSAVLNGSITSNNGYDIIDYGFFWGTSSSSLTDKVAVGTDDHEGAFTATLEDLTAGTTYYFKAYAANEKGTSYGAVLSFSTTGSLPPPVPAPVFSDVSPSHWAYDVITQMSTAGYVYGYPDGTFKPDNTITRAEFATIIDRVLKLQTYDPVTPDFYDVSPGDWFYASVENSFKAGIVQGYGDGIFGPGRSITREELAAILVRSFGKQDEVAASISESTAFTDDAGISAWARGYIVVAVKYGLLKGYPDGSFQPQGNATRAEACTMISNFLSIR